MTDEQWTFHYRFFRKRKITENAFGILVNRFRVLSVPNDLNENNVPIVVLVSLSLHNLLRERSRDTYTPPGFTGKMQMDGNICNGTWSDESNWEFLCPLETTKQNGYCKNAEEIRTTFNYYLCGSYIPWQWRVLI